MDPSRLGRLPPPFTFQPMLQQQQQHEQQQQQQQQQQMQQQHHGHHGHHGHHSSNNSEEDEYSNSSGQNTPGNVSNPMQPHGGGGSRKRGMKTVNEAGEVIRKPRGRPPGSKNKPKPPIIITRETGTGMRPHVLEIGSGFDVHECIATFARRRQRALCVLGASGTVSNVSLRQPGAPPGSSVVTLHGRFDILSLSGTFMVAPQTSPQGSGGGGNGGNGTGPSPPSLMPLPFGNPAAAAAAAAASQMQQSSSGLTISMAGTQGQVIGGCVVGALVSVTSVLVIAASFLGPCFDRLPLDEHEISAAEHAGLNGNGGPSGGAPGGGGHLALGGPSSGPGGSSNSGGPNDPCAMTLYNLPQPSLGNCQITPDILAWAAAGGRPPPF